MGKNYSSVGFIRSDSKTRRRQSVIEREDRPGVAGVQTEHWSGRVDAVAFAPQAKGAGRVGPEEG